MKKKSFMKSKKFAISVEKNLVLIRKYRKVRDHCHCTGKFKGVAHNNCNIRHEIPKDIPIIFHNASTYDYHFIIEQLAIEFKGKFDCLGEYTEKYITFSAPIYKKKNDNDETIIYKLTFIDSFRFMSISLSSLVDNLSEIYKKECELCKDRRIV